MAKCYLGELLYGEMLYGEMLYGEMLLSPVSDVIFSWTPKKI